MEVYSWCPFAGRPTDPRYITCYDPDEEHKPQVFTTRELCNHVLVSHHEMYHSFCENIECYVKQYLCDKDGRRIEVSTIPLDLTYIKNELSKGMTGHSSEIYKAYYAQSIRQLDVLPETIRKKIEKYFEMSGSITNIGYYLNNITPDEPQISGHTIRAYMERHNIKRQLNSDKAEGDIVACILQILSDNPVWVGTPTELHSKMMAGNIVAPTDPSRTSYIINRNKEHLLNNDIQVSRYSRSDFPDSIHVFKGIKNNRAIIVLQRKVDGKFKSFKELCTKLTTSTKDNNMSEFDDVPDIDYLNEGSDHDPEDEAEWLGIPKKYCMLAMAESLGIAIDADEDKERIPHPNVPSPPALDDDELSVFDPRMGHRVMGAAYETTPIVKNHPIEVIGLSILKQSMVGIPDDVVSRIGVKDGDRVIFVDDGENIIIKSAKYVDD